MSESWYNGEWQKVRLQVLARDGYLCRIQLPGCTITATEVDHIIPAPRGAWTDPTNLRAACTNCNQARRHGRPPPPVHTPLPERW